jgi:site-specific DNA recombinase
MRTRPAKLVCCAIYTRVSTDQGLEQDFNSLDAQYDASQAYIRSQAHAGWTLLRAKYDDGGFSGGNTERPALQRLLEDVSGKRNFAARDKPSKSPPREMACAGQVRAS